MRSSNTFGVHFILRNRTVDGKQPVYARITVNKTRCELSLKYYLEKRNWNEGKGDGSDLGREYSIAHLQNIILTTNKETQPSKTAVNINVDAEKNNCIKPKHSASWLYQEKTFQKN